MANAASEFNRVDRDGDDMSGDLTMNIDGPTDSHKVEYVGSLGTGYIQQQIGDLGYEDPNSGAFVKFNDLAGAGGLTMAVYKKFTATPGQVLFDCTPDTYPVGVHAMHVFVDGVWLDHSLFTETSDHEITITGLAPLVGGETVVMCVPRGVPAPGSVFQIMATAADTTPSWANNKIVAGTNVTKALLNPGANEQIQLSAVDSKVKARIATDTTEADLDSKIAAGTNVTKAILNPAGNEQVQINAVDSKVKITVADTTEGVLNDKVVVGAGVTKTTLNPAGNEQLQLSATAAATYTPSTPGDWVGPAPTTVQQALDRIAAALALHGGGPIA